MYQYRANFDQLYRCLQSRSDSPDGPEVRARKKHTVKDAFLHFLNHSLERVPEHPQGCRAGQICACFTQSRRKSGWCRVNLLRFESEANSLPGTPQASQTIKNDKGLLLNSIRVQLVCLKLSSIH